MEKVKLSELGGFVTQVLSRLPQEKTHAAILALQGDLGAGKTTFVQTLAKELGVGEVVQSPTYVLMKSYPINLGQFKKLVHIDAYRLNNAQEFSALKPETFLNDPSVLVAIEWPERVGEALPKPDLTIKFSSQDAGDGERYIEVV